MTQVKDWRALDNFSDLGWESAWSTETPVLGSASEQVFTQPVLLWFLSATAAPDKQLLEISF